MRLGRCATNPWASTQTVRLTLELPGNPAMAARLDVFDALGRRALSRPVTLDAQGAGEAGLLPLPAGVYSARVVAGDRVVTRSLVVR